MKTSQDIIYLILLMFSISWGQDCDENMYYTNFGTPYKCLPTCSNPYYETDNCIKKIFFILANLNQDVFVILVMFLMMNRIVFVFP